MLAPMRAVALLRGINVGGKRKVPMAQLRELAEALGCTKIETYIQSGNLLFDHEPPLDALAVELERALEQSFGFAVPVVVHEASFFAALTRTNPFPDAALERAKLLHVGFAKRPVAPEAEPLLAARATQEKLAVRDGLLWIDFANGFAKTKLTPAVLDKLAGSPVTLRNWNTVVELTQRLGSFAGR
jgi:uncharacterized protein (DUF1697 family)